MDEPAAYVFVSITQQFFPKRSNVPHCMSLHAQIRFKSDSQEGFCEVTDYVIELFVVNIKAVINVSGIG
jgi:hypothetical protein